MPPEDRPTDRPPAIAAAILIQTAASLPLWLVPLVVGAARDHLGLNSGQTGLLATADVTGVLLANAAALLWIRHAHWRRLAAILLIALVLLNAWSAVVHAFGILYPIRIMAGFVAGSLMAICSSLLGATSHPDRNIAMFTGVQLSVVAVCLLVLPGWVAGGGLRPVYGLIAFLAIPGILVCRALPSRSPAIFGAVVRARTGNAKRVSAAMVLAALPTYLFHVGSSASWAYLERIGLEAGLNASDVGIGLAAAMLAGIAGSVSAFTLGLRLGWLTPLLAVFVLQAFAIGLLSGDHLGMLRFTAGLLLLGFGFNAALGYQFGLANAFRPEGRTAVAFLLLLQAGVMTGPLAASRFVRTDHHEPALWLAGAFFLASTLVATYLSRVVARGRS